MKCIYAGEPIVSTASGLSVFLAGPRPSIAGQISWRREAADIFRRLKYPGTLCIPENRKTPTAPLSTGQLNWTSECLCRATVCVFWMEHFSSTSSSPLAISSYEMALVQFGQQIGKAEAEGSPEVLYGRPEGTENCEYLDWLCKNVSQPYTTLEALVQATMDLFTMMADF